MLDEVLNTIVEYLKNRESAAEDYYNNKRFLF